MLTYFKSSIIFTIVSLIAAFYLGYSYTHTIMGALGIVAIVAILAVLEVSLSFDNAIVNAKVLKQMDDVWRNRFLTWGMVIAVFGMRIVFPLLIVSIATGMSLVHAFMLALQDAATYEKILTSVHHEVLAFGGIFLLMVALTYFFDIEKDVHWVRVIEEPLVKAGKLYMVEALIAIASLVSISYFVDSAEKLPVIISGLCGLMVYAALQWVEILLGTTHGTENIAKAGLASFIYLEVLDASFSFDGVIGAFALSNNILIIALGLGVGAMFVRSLTIFFVKNETLDNYTYLEHGAFWAILFLAGCMLIGLFVEISEIVTGLSGAIIIGTSLYSSLKHARTK